MSFILFQACSSGGAPFKEQLLGGPVVDFGPYRFTPGVRLYRQSFGSEVILEKTRRPDRTYFRMRLAGQEGSGAIRMRSYRGTAHLLGSVLELRSEKCYLYGKREWVEGWVPLERWDCDHLFFRHRSANGFTAPEILQPAPSEKTLASNWLGAFPLVPLPRYVSSAFVTEPEVTFAGQILGELDDGRVIVWGYRASKILRDGFELTVLNDVGVETGVLKVEARTDDMAIARWVSKLGSGGVVAYTTRVPEKSGWLD